MEKALQRERLQLDERVSQRVEEQKRLNKTKNQKLIDRIEALEKKAATKKPINELRFWHSRWRCMACKLVKTDEIGEWTCPECGVEQNNCM